jgi:hypothetical protein
MGAPDSPVRHRTDTVPYPVRRHITRPFGFGVGSTVGALSFGGTGQSGAPLTSCSDFCCDNVYFAESTVGVDSRCSAGSPDSSVNYSGACLHFPESDWLTSVRSLCTGHSPVHHSLAHSSPFAPLKLCP